jgi:hypothetical protein
MPEYEFRIPHSEGGIHDKEFLLTHLDRELGRASNGLEDGEGRREIESAYSESSFFVDLCVNPSFHRLRIRRRKYPKISNPTTAIRIKFMPRNVTLSVS